MDFIPPRSLGSIIGGALLAVLFGVAVLGAYLLATTPVTPASTLWLLMPVICLPISAAVGYRLHGLWTASYHVDRDQFLLRWGAANERLPVSAISSVRLASDLATGLRPRPGLWWPGCVVGERDVADLGKVEFFATQGPHRTLVLSSGAKNLAISPADPEEFFNRFREAARMGSLQPVEPQSGRASLLLGLWRDRLSQALLLAGALLPVALFAFLAFQVPVLPAQVPFGFDPLGRPDTMAPPERLLLLPLIAGACWFVDAVYGTWLAWRGADRAVAYVVWGSAILLGALMWGSMLHLIYGG